MTVWTVRLSNSAEQDYRDILCWTRANFGPQQAKVYARTINSALRELNAGPAVVGAKLRPDLGPGLFTLHVARRGRKGRHFVIFRIGRTEKLKQPGIDVLRLLHDSMDLSRHAVAAEGDSGGTPD